MNSIIGVYLCGARNKYGTILEDFSARKTHRICLSKNKKYENPNWIDIHVPDYKACVFSQLLERIVPGRSFLAVAR